MPIIRKTVVGRGPSRKFLREADTILIANTSRLTIHKEGTADASISTPKASGTPWTRLFQLVLRSSDRSTAAGPTNVLCRDSHSIEQPSFTLATQSFSRTEHSWRSFRN